MKNQTRKHIKYTGGFGFSFKTAIKILNAKDNTDGVYAEYDYIRDKFGKEGIDWFQKEQKLDLYNGVFYDVLTILLKDQKTTIDLFFDVSDFFGRHPLLAEMFPGWDYLKMQQSYVDMDFKKGKRVNFAHIKK